MRSTVLLVALLTVVDGCRAVHPGHALDGVAARSRSDTVSVLAAVWRTAAVGHEGRRITWLHLPEAGTAAFTASAEVRAGLQQRGVPASERQPAGDDTVVFHVREWASDSGGAALLHVYSRWTKVLGGGRWRCRTGSSNSESYRAVRSSAGWAAELVGPVGHGDGACARIP